MSYRQTEEKIYMPNMPKRKKRNPRLELPAKWRFLEVETLLKRHPKYDRDKVPQFTGGAQVTQFIVEVLEHLNISDRERLYAIFLDQKNSPIGIHEVHVGTLTESIAHPRELFRAAVLADAAAIAFIHNHPSGVPEPSKQDVALNGRLSKAADIMGIRLLDFLVIGSQGKYYSFAESGIL